MSTAAVYSTRSRATERHRNIRNDLNRASAYIMNNEYLPKSVSHNTPVKDKNYMVVGKALAHAAVADVASVTRRHRDSSMGTLGRPNRESSLTRTGNPIRDKSLPRFKV